MVQCVNIRHSVNTSLISQHKNTNNTIKVNSTEINEMK